jgi:hypothetical protein
MSRDCLRRQTLPKRNRWSFPVAEDVQQSISSEHPLGPNLFNAYRYRRSWRGVALEFIKPDVDNTAFGVAQVVVPHSQELL